MKKLTRDDLKNLHGGDGTIGTIGGDGGSCSCLPGDPQGTCKTISPCGLCQCTSNGAPATYDLNDATCNC